MKRKNKTKIFDILRVAGLLVAFSVLLYPTISNYLYEKNSSKVISFYDEETIRLNEQKKNKLLEEAITFNQELSGNIDFTDPFLSTRKEIDRTYQNTLNINGSGMMGYIKIPKIKIELPIYHGTQENILQSGVGHLEGTSFPVGGESTHCVLTGHRGLPSKMLFTDLDKLEIGDVFYIKILGETLSYEVDQILTVLPEETKELSIMSGEEYVTLVTCTPYAVNTHRLLIRGRAMPYEEAVKIVPDEKQKRMLPFQIRMFILAIFILIILLIGYNLYSYVYKRKNKNRREKND